MKREYRLRKGSEFDTVYAEGTVINGPFVVLRVVPNNLGHPRWGFAVGKKIAPKATARNRMRRLLKEAARSLGRSDSLDVVVTARRNALDSGVFDLARSISRGLDSPRVRGDRE